MQPTAHLIVVDDDADIRETLQQFLGRHGYGVRCAACVAELDDLLARHPADLVILDWIMPGEDGLSACRRLTATGFPVLMLSALDSPPDKVIGLEFGADDYLAKPFDPRELLARVRALLRRGSRERAADGAADLRYCFDGWRLRPAWRSLTAPSGLEVALTAGEHALLKALVTRAGRVLTREQLLALTQGESAETVDRAIDLAISRLRRKLAGGAAHGGALIQTMRGEGYRFAATVRRE